MVSKFARRSNLVSKFASLWASSSCPEGFSGGEQLCCGVSGFTGWFNLGGCVISRFV